MKYTLTLSALAMMTSAAMANEQTIYQWPNVYQGDNTSLQQLTKSSHEYWQTVSGRELKQGVAVHVTQADHLIRVAPKARFDSGTVIKPQQLQMDKLQLRDAKTDATLALKSIAAQQQMHQAGFKDGSVAIQLKNVSAQGKPMLQSTQPLGDDDQYLVHVVEKDSPYALKAHADFRVDEQQRSLAMDLSIAQQGNASKAANNVSLRVHSPVNEQLSARYANGKVIFSQPLQHVGAAQGFYEIEADTTVNINGQQVKRTIKLPFVYSKDTITMKTAKVSALGNNRFQASVPVNVSDEGRYAIRATLQGMVAGKATKLATVEVAKAIKGVDTFTLPFDVATAATGPFKLVDIELSDHTRMLKFTPTQKFVKGPVAGF
ncbi:hypothetical protein CWC05_15870 [Pseudoalteromonas ruthenica]|uniref:DUF4785 domain-containing protein n=1 Tax=Pseudoalteromonas ruthenica TaxID=151081 RepID=A0A5S3Z1G9_9GAMM|nr:DUF4785 domain-containing protein [Pseudoalteromonas ruthenica]TMP86072.1 hypothetical protein CWC05_15870 [Pseudoalteromonas ruthenica]